MKLLLSPDCESALIDALTEAGPREIGGILMGEHLGLNTFRVSEITLQKTGGTFAAFKRVVEAFLGPLRAFFDATNHDYRRFNYLGEWHSHHSFALVPSATDHRTMYDLIEDPLLGARFVVLMLVRLDDRLNLEIGLTLYRPGEPPVDIEAPEGL